jgi:hypothetical protein
MFLISHSLFSESYLISISFTLSGGAGVGKSDVLKTVNQALLRFYDTQPGQNPDDIREVIAATTGKAAYNVKGNTLRSLFHIIAIVCKPFTHNVHKTGP